MKRTLVAAAVVSAVFAAACTNVSAATQAVLKPTNATAIYKQVPATVFGIDGTTFFSSSQDGNGGTVDLKLTVLLVNGRYIAMETVGTPTVMTSALETTLKSVTKGISLKVAK